MTGKCLVTRGRVPTTSALRHSDKLHPGSGLCPPDGVGSGAFGAGVHPSATTAEGLRSRRSPKRVFRDRGWGTLITWKKRMRVGEWAMRTMEAGTGTVRMRCRRAGRGNSRGIPVIVVRAVKVAKTAEIECQVENSAENGPVMPVTYGVSRRVVKFLPIVIGSFSGAAVT